MTKFRGQKSGSVTVFFALAFPLSLLLFLTLIESARTAGLPYMLKEAAETSGDCLLACYNRQLFDEYGILAYDGGYSDGITDYTRMEEEIAYYLWENLSNGGFFLGGGSLFPIDVKKVTVTETETLLDNGAESFIRSAVMAFQSESLSYLTGKAKDAVNSFLQGNQAKADAEIQKKELMETDWTETDEETGTITIDDADVKKEIGESVIGDADEAKKTPILSLVLPGKSVSGGALEEKNLPSSFGKNQSGTGEFVDLLMKTEFNEYLVANFPDYLTGKGAAENGNAKTSGNTNTKMNGNAKTSGNTNAKTNGNAPLRYELEYILFGHFTDRENLQASAESLLLTREGMNLLFLLKSPKREEVRSIALAMATAIELPVLADLIAIALLSAWAFAEAVLDVRALLCGRRISLLKTEDEWTSGIENLAELFSEDVAMAKESKTGLSYSDCLHTLLYMQNVSESAYRAMDLIQAKMQKYSPHFLMEAAITSFTFSAECSARELFTSLPIIRRGRMKNEKEYEYSVKAVVKKTY